MTQPANHAVPDAAPGHWVEAAPAWLRPYLRLARYDRPVGFWLLAAPCWIGLALAHVATGPELMDAWYAVLFGVGAIAMRGAGCTYNDIVDRDLDAQVARTAARPLPSGQLQVSQAWTFLGVQLLVGLVVLLLLPRAAQIVALLAVPLVLAYPFMKRITWFPQAWLGVTMNWGALVGYAALTGGIDGPALVMLAGLAAWTFGYDTIYARLDVDDDALAGVKSTARFFGEQARLAVGIAYAVAVALALIASLWAASGASTAGANAAGAALAVAYFAGRLAWQVLFTKFDDDVACLAAFRSNAITGAAFAAALAALPALSRALAG